jgi:hypothetical protein
MNGYLNSSAAWTYITTNPAALYQQSNNTHNFEIAASGTAGNPITWTSAMYINGSGNVGIGTSSPSYTLHVNGSVAGTSAYVNLSDKRYKKNIAPITDALSKVEQLNGVMFDWDTEKDKTINLDTKRHIGVLAQDVEQVVPEAVSTAKDGRKSVAYTDLVPLLIEAIKEQQKQIKDLQLQVKQLSKQP